MPIGHVISDLHLFAHRSVAESSMSRIRRAAARSDFFVLNGDIFDFRWSTLPTVDDTLDAAVRWLRVLAADNPKCRFLYTLGNHDSYEPFIGRLRALAETLPNLEWHESHVRVDNAFFLHGDLPLVRRSDHPGPLRAHPRLGRNGRTLRIGYRMFVAARGPRLVAQLHRPRSCARQITRWLEADPDGLADGVTDVYFGHIHQAFSDFEYGGRKFHNTGSTIRGLRSRIFEVQTSGARGANSG